VVGKTIAGRYELEEVVGHGGMSSVYRAHDSLLERWLVRFQAIQARSGGSSIP